MTVVSDSSPLVILTKLGCFDLLNRLFSRVYISAEVHDEVVVVGTGLPGAAEVSSAKWIEVKQLQNPASLLAAQQKQALGLGEISTILLAKELGANPVLLDDYKARMFAKAEGLQILGSVGLLEAFYARVSTRKTSGKADCGAAVQRGSRTETARKLSEQGLIAFVWSR